MGHDIPCPSCAVVPVDDYCADCDIIVSHDICDECAEEACDRCGIDVPNGSGHYPEGDTGDRVCAYCAEEGN